MAENDVVGREGAEFGMAVERGKIREFARATGSRHKDYLNRAKPPMPATFLMTSAFWQPADGGGDLIGDLGLDLRRILHGEQEFVFPGGPPKSGALLKGKGRVESMYEKEGKRGGTMTFIVMVTDFTDKQGNVVAQTRNTLIQTGKPPTEE